MAFNVESTLQAIQSYLAASGHVRAARIGEPKAPPDEEVAAAVIMQSASVVGATLNDTIELHVATIRIYTRTFTENPEDEELLLARVASEIAEDIAGDYDLGATVRNVDIAGQYGTPMATRWGYLDVGGTVYRIVDITVPVIVDGSSALTP